MRARATVESYRAWQDSFLINTLMQSHLLSSPAISRVAGLVPHVRSDGAVRGGHAQGRDAGARCCAACCCAACCCAACCCGITVHVAQAEREVLLTRAVEPRVWEMVRHVARGLAHIHSYEARDRAEIAPRSRRDRIGRRRRARTCCFNGHISAIYLGYISAIYLGYISLAGAALSDGHATYHI